MRWCDDEVRRTLQALGLSDDHRDLLPFIARNGWTAQVCSWRPPDMPTRWPAVRIQGKDGVELGFGVDPGGYLGDALVAAVVDAVERVG